MTCLATPAQIARILQLDPTVHTLIGNLTTEQADWLIRRMEQRARRR